MDRQRENQFYKGISLCLKALIIAASCWYIYTKVFHRPDLPDLLAALINALAGEKILLFSAIVVLMPLNWLLEAIKWRSLITPLERISLADAYKGVLCGVAVSTVTPNRAGEFAGKVFSLRNADKIQASILSVAGSACQLLCTIFFAALGFFILRYAGLDAEVLPEYYTGFRVLSLVAVLVFFFSILLVLLFSLLSKRTTAAKSKLHKAFESVRQLGRKKLVYIIALSCLRYFVFFIQFHLLLVLFDAGVSFRNSTILIPLVFFAVALVPTFALTEIGVRGAAALVIFQPVTENSTAVLTTSFVLWIINIAVPALAGCFFVLRLKFFRNT